MAMLGRSAAGAAAAGAAAAGTAAADVADRHRRHLEHGLLPRARP